MPFIITLLLLLIFATSVQAEWNWLFWERHTRKNGQQEEVITDWKEVALFADKNKCEDHVEAVLYRHSELFSQRKDGSEVLFMMFTEGENLGKLAGVLSKKGNQSSLIEARCLQKATAMVMHKNFRGNDYRRLTSVEKRRYIMGILDGTLGASIFGAPKENMEWIEKCVQDATSEQSMAITEKYIANNPEIWNELMLTIFLRAMHQTCYPQKK